MEHAWGWWWIFPILMFFWFAPHRRHRRWERDPRPVRAEPDEETKARLALVDQLETRVSELENRLDFTERLLAERSATSNSA
ncbi:MAG TPA: hypothetical protein VHJ69_01810 [Gemmatimonadales bacterium]|jgi:hypothetical protein|nr:hypothetical protein [Gemmatimonadales bacterium]